MVPETFHSMGPMNSRRRRQVLHQTASFCWIMILVCLLFSNIFRFPVPALLPLSSEPTSSYRLPIEGVPDSISSNVVAEASAISSETFHTDQHQNEHNFTIVVLTMNRFKSLERLLTSLQQSEYPAHQTVNLVVKFDVPPQPDATTKTQSWRETVHDVESTWRKKWTYGTATFSVAEKNKGLRQAWLDAWIPSSQQDRAIIFEDDIEVSPVWFSFLTEAYASYQDRQDIAGISLQRQTLVPRMKARNKKVPDNKGQPFLYKLVGSIGYSPFAEPWMDFLDFASCALATELDVAIPGLITTVWYATTDKRSMWTQLFVYFCDHRDLYTLYYLPTSAKYALAAHLREKGEHFKDTLGRDFDIAETQLPDTYPKDLVKLDWDARPVPVNYLAWQGLFRTDSQKRILNHNCFPSPVVHAR